MRSGRKFQSRFDVIDRSPLMEYVPHRVVLHLADFIDVIVQRWLPGIRLSFRTDLASSSVQVK